jgi:hypothetical protein
MDTFLQLVSRCTKVGESGGCAVSAGAGVPGVADGGVAAGGVGHMGA